MNAQLPPVMRAFVDVAQKRSLAPKTPLIHAGMPATALYWLLEGTVSVTHANEQDRKLILGFRYPGEFVGEECLFGVGAVSTATVVTRKATLVAGMGTAAFRQFAAQHPDIMTLLASQMAARLQSITERVVDQAYGNVNERLIRGLKDLAQLPDAEKVSGGMRIRISRGELASYLGYSREMIARGLAQLEDQGNLTRIPRGIIVHPSRRAGIEPRIRVARPIIFLRREGHVQHIPRGHLRLAVSAFR